MFGDTTAGSMLNRAELHHEKTKMLAHLNIGTRLAALPAVFMPIVAGIGMIGVAVGTVKSRMFSAVQRLKESLKGLK